MSLLISDDEFIAVIKKHQGENLTVRRIMELTGYYSTSTVHQRLKQLENEGRIKTKRLTIIEVIE